MAPWTMAQWQGTVLAAIGAAEDHATAGEVLRTVHVRSQPDVGRSQPDVGQNLGPMWTACTHICATKEAFGRGKNS